MEHIRARQSQAASKRSQIVQFGNPYRTGRANRSRNEQFSRCDEAAKGQVTLPASMRKALGIKLFLDANVLFTAAHRPNGKAAFLFEVASSSRATVAWTLVSSAYAIDEARRNIEVKAPGALEAFKKLVARLSVVPQPSVSNRTPRLPDKDLPIWSAAHHCGATHLLIGAIKDFGRWMNRPDATADIIVQTVAEFLAAI